MVKETIGETIKLGESEMMGNNLSALSLFICAIGAINWGLIGALNFNVVVWLAILVKLHFLIKTIYIIIGIAGLYSLFDNFSGMISK